MIQAGDTMLNRKAAENLPLDLAGEGHSLELSDADRMIENTVAGMKEAGTLHGDHTAGTKGLKSELD